MTDQPAVSVGPDVNAILNGSADAPAQIADSNFSDDGAGIVQMEGSTPAAKPEGEGEELILGKFKTQADLEKAYKALEGKLGSKQETPAEEPAADPKDDGVPTMGEKPEGEAEGEPEGYGEETEAGSEAGETEDKGDEAPALDFEALGNEFAENGELSDASYETLEKSGISREITDQYIEGFRAIQTLRGQQLYTAAGGEAEFKSIVEWGTNNLPQEQQDAFNNAINSAILEGDFTASSMLIQAVKSQMGNGEPNLLNTNSGTASDGVEPFKSRSDMAAAMRDPRYATDAGYNAEVQRRLAISEF
jgi:hypothetical protein